MNINSAIRTNNSSNINDINGIMPLIETNNKSYKNDVQSKDKSNCYTAYTNAKTKEEALIALEEIEDDIEAKILKYSNIQNESKEILSKTNTGKCHQITAKAKQIGATGILEINTFFKKALEDDVKNWDINTDLKIGPSAQRRTGDCWLLSALNSFAANERGAQLLKDATTYNKENGIYSIELKGPDKKYDVSEKDIYNAHKAHRENFSYSTGDDDVIVWEIAFEKALSGTCYDTDGESPLDGGTLNKFTQMLTGKNSLEIKSEFDNVFNFIEKYPEFHIATLGIVNKDGKDIPKTIIKDIDGNDVAICAYNYGHAWSLISVDGDVLTCINPINPSAEVRFLKDEIIKYTDTVDVYRFDDFYNYIDDSDDA